LQTNRDLLKAKILDELLEEGIKIFSIANLDCFHKHAVTKLQPLKECFIA
jgi:hypothetical protein